MLIFLLAAFVAAMAQPGWSASASPTTIRAEGHGEGQGPPDTLLLTISIDSSAASAAQAAQMNDDAVTRATNMIAQTLGSRGSITRSGYSLNPQYLPQNQSPPSGFEAYRQIQAHFPAGTFSDERIAALVDEIRSQGVGFQGSSVDGSDQTISFEVISFANTAEEATRLNSPRAGKAIDTVKSQLGEGAKITSDSSLMPKNDTNVSLGLRQSAKPSGFLTHSDLVIESKAIDLLPAVVKKVEGLEGVAIRSVQFVLRDRTKVQQSAIAHATHDAESKAQAEAAALKVKLGPLINSSVDIEPGSAQVSPGTFVGAHAGIALSPLMPPSGVNVSAIVILTYAIQ